MNPSQPAAAYNSHGDSGADDILLMGRVKGGDEAALATLYDKWVRQVYSIVVQLVKDADDAEDVVEDTFWQVWQKASSYNEEKGPVSSWLLTIGRRKALDRLRAKRRQKEDLLSEAASADDWASTEASPLEESEADERRTKLIEAMRLLPDEQRQALVLGYFRGLSQTEIATVTGEALGTIKTRMRLGMQKLKEPLSVLREEPA